MFWIIVTVLTLMALAFILPSLMKQDKINDGTREQNITIAKEQLDELESRFKQGEIDEKSYQETKEELEFSLFNDLKNTDLDSVTSNPAKSGFSWLILSLVPLISVPLYMQNGNLDYAEQVDPDVFARKAHVSEIPPLKDGKPDLKRMIASLKYEVENNPDSFEGWYLLGRSYALLKQHSNAIKPLDNALKLKPDDLKTMLSLLDALVFNDKSKLTGRPRKLANEILMLEPNNSTALWLSGMAAFQAGELPEAVEKWETLLPFLENRPQDKRAVTTLLLSTKNKLNPSQLSSLKKQPEKKEVSNNAGVKVSISLSDEFKSKVSQDDFVFIYAKAMNGPPMPLAALKKQVKDLPINVELNDQMAMIDGLTISSFKDLSVGARVSKTGQPIASNGDLFGEKDGISLGDSVTLEINETHVK